MHPLAHILTGALIGQLAPSPAAAVLGGFASHYVLDVIPHAEGKTFRPASRARPGPELLEAGVEFAAGLVLTAWVAGTCPGAKAVSVGMGAVAALLPDLIDIPLKFLFDFSLLHSKRWHWTVTRRGAVWGILTQVVVATAAGVALWRASGCR